MALFTIQIIKEFEMKKIISLICVLICLSMLLASCGDPVPSAQNSSTADSEQTGSSVDSSTVDSSTVDSSTVDSSTVDSSTVDSSTVDSSTVDSSTSDSSKNEDVTPDPEPEIPDGPIDIAVNGETQYVIVYDDRNEAVCEFTTRLVEYISSRYDITFEAVKESDGVTHENCIYIGDVAGAQRAKSKFNEVNDFGAVVSGDDYVLYATNNRLYNYLYELMVKDVLVSIRSGNWSTRPAKNMIYHKSEYAEITYADYLIAQNGGTFTKDIMMQIFEERTFVGREMNLPYRIYVPFDYDESKSYPVLTILHGAGERGTNNTSQMANMVFNLFKNKENPVWNSIVICPQCPGWPNQWVDTPWGEGDYRIDEVDESTELIAVMQLLNAIESDYATDTNRYYVTGLSMGGFGTWDLMMRHTDRFAAAVPLCGGADQTQAHKLVDKPIYTIHGTNDGDVPISGTQVMVDAILALGGEKIIYEKLSGYGHNVWDYAGNKLEIWQWLFSQSLENQ